MYPATTRKVLGGQHSLEEKNHQVFEWRLPANGEKYDDCGQVRCKVFCPTCKEWQHELLEHCYRADCPVCYKQWIARESGEATDRLYSGFYMLRELDRGVQLHHVVWSVPKDEYEYSYEDLRKRFHYRRRVAGSIAGLVIFHPYRFRSVKSGCAVAWKHCSLNPVAESPVVESYASYEPHFHTLSTGFLMASSAFYERFGWTYKKLHHKKPIFKKNDMRGVIWYALSHAGLGFLDGERVYHALSWYGKFSNNQMVCIRTEVEYIDMLCDHCETQLVLVHSRKVVQDDVDRSHIEENFKELWVKKVTKRHYRFK